MTTLGMVYDLAVDKRDYIGECNEHAVAVDDFHAAFCVRCLQTECTRSALGKSQFETRVSTWADRLFLNVPRLDPEDPRYKPLATQKFVSIDVGRVAEVRGWIDPLEAQPPEPTPPVATPATQPEPTEVRATAPGRLPRHMILGNAPDQSGRMLAGATPAKDSWATPEPEKNVGNVVSAGARVKLGGSGV